MTLRECYEEGFHSAWNGSTHLRRAEWNDDQTAAWRQGRADGLRVKDQERRENSYGNARMRELFG